MANEAWQSPIEGMDVTDAYEPQLLPAGVELDGVIEQQIDFNREAMILNFKIAPMSLPSGIDPSKPVKRVEWSVFLPNSAKDDADKLNNKKLMLKRVKDAFGIPLTENLQPQHFAGRTVRFTTKERQQKPEEEAKYGKRIEVDVIIRVTN